jgi:hypothetical protein
MKCFCGRRKEKMKRRKEVIGNVALVTDGLELLARRWMRGRNLDGKRQGMGTSGDEAKLARAQ